MSLETVALRHAAAGGGRAGDGVAAAPPGSSLGRFYREHEQRECRLVFTHGGEGRGAQERGQAKTDIKRVKVPVRGRAASQAPRSCRLPPVAN